MVAAGTGWTTTNPAVGGTGNVVFSKASVGVSESAVFTIVVKVNSSAAENSGVTNTATAASTTADPNSNNNSDTAINNVITRADLAVTKTASPTPNVFAGSNITYTINLSNNGPSDAQTVTVTDAVPANTSLVSAVVTTGTGWSTNTSGPIVFSKSVVIAGESAVFTIVVKVNSNTASGTVISNTATTATTTTDPNSANNSSTA